MRDMDLAAGEFGVEHVRPRAGVWWAVARFLRLPLMAYVLHVTIFRATGRMVPSGEIMQVRAVSSTGIVVRRGLRDSPLMTEETVVVREWDEFVSRRGRRR